MLLRCFLGRWLQIFIKIKKIQIDGSNKTVEVDLVLNLDSCSTRKIPWKTSGAILFVKPMQGCVIRKARVGRCDYRMLTLHNCILTCLLFYFNFFVDLTTAQIELENTQLINDLYRLLKKYLGLRHLIRVLKVSK